MGRPRAHTAATGETLLDAAESLLAEGGEDAVTVRAVAEASGTTTRAVYSVFGSKDALVEGLAARGYHLLAGYVAGLPASDDAAADLVTAGIRGFRRFALERPHLFGLTFGRLTAETFALPSVPVAALASYQALGGWIARARAAGVLDDRPDVEVGFAFHALCVGLAINELARRPPPEGAGFWRTTLATDGEDLWRGALSALVAGMRPPAAVSPP